MAMGDEAVIATNDDATACKRSAVHFGYIEDPYLPHMAPKNVPRKAPEIHLGYFTRVRGMLGMLLKSIEAIKQSEMEPIQIVNLGSGFDTLYWRLKVTDQAQALRNPVPRPKTSYSTGYFTRQHGGQLHRGGLPHCDSAQVPAYQEVPRAPRQDRGAR